MLGVYDKKRLVNYHIASRRERLTTYEGYDFAFAPTGKPPPTAWWSYDVHRHRHNIVFSEDVDVSHDRRPSASTLRGWFKRTRWAFLEKVYDHEGGHSLYTERDYEKRKAYKVPHHLLNLFEDARIEAKWRKEMHRRFNWLRYCLTTDERPPPKGIVLVVGEPASAVNLFLDCIMMENSPRLLNDWALKDKDPKIPFEGKGKARFHRRHLIRWYYRRAIRASETAALVPIINSWLKTFPETGSPMAGVIGIGPGGMDIPEDGDATMPAYAVDADGSKHEEIEETVALGTKPTDSDGPTPTKVKKKEEEEEFESKKFDIPRNEFFRKERQRTMDFNRTERLIRLFEKFLEGGEGVVTTRNPSGKIDMRQFLRGSDEIYLTQGDDPEGVKDISFIFDCSGSMNDASHGRAPVEEGVYLAHILNELTRRGKITCRNMILSGGNNHAIQMPFDSRILNHLVSPGGIEGFASAMRDHEKELVKTDLTIFFTDGDITDEHIIKEEWHRKGVYTIGLYTGNPKKSVILHKWFDSVLVRNDIESIADSLIQLIKR